jgi:hypothetical protein
MKAAKGIRCLDHRAIAAHTGHRGQCIHLLCARQLARQCIDREHGGLLRDQALHQVRVLRRPHEADKSSAFAHRLDFVGARRTDLEDDL